MASRSRRISDHDVLLRLIAAAADGLRLDNIEAAHGLEISQRTLLRRLEAMEQTGLITKTGSRRSARYRAASPALTAEPPPRPPTQAELVVPLSQASADIMAQIRSRFPSESR